MASDPDYRQTSFPGVDLGETKNPEPKKPAREKQRINSGANIPLEIDSGQVEGEETNAVLPELPARWEAARDAAQRKNVLQILLGQIRRVPALDLLEHLIGLSGDEGYVWVVYGASGSGKSAFFNTLEYQTGNK